jgi:ACT domain-containing protein
MTTQQEKILKPKLGLLELAKQLGNVSQACKIMGYSRDTFYRYKELFMAVKPPSTKSLARNPS